MSGEDEDPAGEGVPDTSKGNGRQANTVGSWGVIVSAPFEPPRSGGTPVNWDEEE